MLFNFRVADPHQKEPEMNFRTSIFAICALGTATPLAASAQETALNGADTAWVLVAAALVLFMTLPGLALFYGGLVRSK
jgi:Amt family ammonium transporter